MANIRARFSLRLIFLFSTLGLAVALFIVFRSEGRQDWRDYQKSYKARNHDLLSKKVSEAREGDNQEDLKNFNKLLQEAGTNYGPRVEQIFLPDAGVRDLCRTCHAALENKMFMDAENPLRAHPEEILRHHKPNRFGCTLCHHGQGVGLTVEKAHGYEENWPLPRVPAGYVQGLCLGCHETPFGLKGAEKAEKGRALFVEHGCFGCHKARTLEDLPSMAAPFEGVGAKIYNAQWILQWIKDPQRIRPGNRMPSFRLKDEEILAVVAYLASGKDLPVKLEAYDRKNASYKRGRELFVEKGCIACHSDWRKTSCLTGRVPNLSDAGLKLYSRWIATWLQDPSSLNPETAMPRLMLTAEERRDLTAYLKSRRAKEVKKLLDSLPEDSGKKGDTEEGRRLVQLMGCYGCHPVRGMEKLALPGVAVAEGAGKRLEELPFGNSTVPHTKWDWLFQKIKKPAVYETEDMPLKMPDYKLSDSEIEALTTFYLNNDYYDLPEHYLSRSSLSQKAAARGDWMIGHYNCRGCHQLKDNTNARIAQFMKLKSLVPPRLVDEAERVQPQWFFQYLSRPIELRPWLAVRMPEFNWTYADRKDLIEYFLLELDPKTREAVRVPYVLMPVREDYDPEVLEMGAYRFQTDKCMQCHPVSFDNQLPDGVKLEDLSINLMLSKNRLRFEWIKNFLRNPDKYAGQGTKMPFVYYTPDRVPRVPDPEMWIEYVSLFTMFMEKVPEGKKEESIEEIRPGAETDWTQYE